MFSVQTIKAIKGFTLFTALVSFIVIGTGMLVMQHMSNSEQNYSQIIKGIKTQAEMESIKDFLVLESFNVFNILLRATVYDFFNESCTKDEEESRICTQGSRLMEAYPIKFDNTPAQDIDEFQGKEFFKSPPGQKSQDPKVQRDCTENVFARYVAQGITSNIGSFSGSFRNVYNFRVYDPCLVVDDLGHVNIENSGAVSGGKYFNLANPQITLNLSQYCTEQALTHSFCKDRADQLTGNTIFVVVGCDDGSDNDCKNGSFYIKANFLNITDKDYFNLPRIYLNNTTYYTSLDDAIVPRSNLRFYIPFRLFGAMHFAKSVINIDKMNELAGDKYGTLDSSSNVVSSCNMTIPYTDARKINMFEDNDIIKNICKNQSKIDNFELDDCEVSAVSETVKTYTLGNWGQAILQKLSSVSVVLTVIDTDPNYMFGSKKLVYNFVIVKSYEVESEESVTCSCSLSEGQSDLIHCK